MKSIRKKTPIHRLSLFADPGRQLKRYLYIHNPASAKPFEIVALTVMQKMLQYF